MKKSIKKVLVIAAMLTLTLSITAQAKTKKLAVNAVYTSAKKVTGTSKLKKAKVVAKIGKKTYKAKSNSKGKFTIKIKKKRTKGTKIKVTVYKNKKVYAKKTVKVKTKPWYLYKPFKGHNAAIGGSGLSYRKVPNQYDSEFVYYVKKGYKAKFKYGKYEETVSTQKYSLDSNGKSIPVGKPKTINSVNASSFFCFSSKGKTAVPVGSNKIKIEIYRNKDNKLVDSYSITPKKIKLPGKTDAIDYEQFLKDYNKAMKTGVNIDKDVEDYRYEISSKGYLSIGYPSHYIETEADGAHATITAKNGAILYYTIGVKGNFDFDPPTLTKYDGIIKSGQTKKFEGWDFKEGELIHNNLYEKVYAYKNGKLVAIFASTQYLIQGYADWMFK